MTVTLDVLVSRSPNCLSANVAEEVVLMSIDGGQYIGLDAIAADIWQRMEQPCMVCDLLDSLLTDYDAPRAEIEADMLALLDTLVAAGVVVVGRESG